MKLLSWTYFAFVLFALFVSAAAQSTNLCTVEDPDFEAFYYREHIPRCKRNVSSTTKREVARMYGIPDAEWKKYHYDHVVSLCAGGSNSIENLQPRLPEKKLQKDKIEWATCRELDKGAITQQEAIERLSGLRVQSANE